MSRKRNRLAGGNYSDRASLSFFSDSAAAVSSSAVLNRVRIVYPDRLARDRRGNGMPGISQREAEFTEIVALARHRAEDTLADGRMAFVVGEWVVGEFFHLPGRGLDQPILSVAESNAP